MKKLTLMVTALFFWSIVFVLPSTAQEPATCVAEYTVKAGDGLTVIAQTVYGDRSVYQQIIDATNARAATDPSFQEITDRGHIEVGWKLCLPAIEGRPSPAVPGASATPAAATAAATAVKATGVATAAAAPTAAATAAPAAATASTAAATAAPASPTPASATPQATQTAEAAPPTITGILWKLQEVQMMDDRTTQIADPDQYTLELQPGGPAAVKAACNYRSATYRIAGSQLSLTTAATTLALCSPPSLSDQYVAALNAANSYVVKDGNLYISFGIDSGILEFAPDK